MAFLPGYDIALARKLVSGADDRSLRAASAALPAYRRSTVRLTRSKPVRRQSVRMLRKTVGDMRRRIFPMHGEQMPCYLAAFPDEVLR